jgi:hypothetical protein
MELTFDLLGTGSLKYFPSSVVRVFFLFCDCAKATELIKVNEIKKSIFFHNLNLYEVKKIV